MCAVLYGLAASSFGQVGGEEEKNFWERWEAYKEHRIAEGRTIFTPILAPAYSPELGFLIAGGGLLTGKTNRKDTLLRRSSMPFTIGYSSTGAIIAQLKITSYWFSDKVRMDMTLKYRDMPDHYFGVGYDAAANTPKGDQSTSYTRQFYQFDPRVLYQFSKDHFFGFAFDINYTEGSDESPGVLSDSTYLFYNIRPLNTGVGLIYRYDSRDIPVNCYNGMFFDIRALFYTAELGGDNEYTIYTADLRKYWQISKPGRTIASRAVARFGTGSVPYGEMSQLGGSSDLRGYRNGQYRDKSYIMLMGEYRHMFYKRNGNMSKHGLVGWLGTGSVFDGDSGTLAKSVWLPNVGFGYRFEVEDRMNIRLDIGFGRNTSGFYLNFHEAY